MKLSAKLQLAIPAFRPLVRNRHLATILGNFWPRPASEESWPVADDYYETEPGVKVLVRRQDPADPKGEVILVHGLEGSSESGYMRSMAHALLTAGFSVHRYNMRGCGESPWHPKANYHSGQTFDLLRILRERKQASRLPLFAAGFSLGGNMVLKLAGELGEQGGDLLTGVCSVCAPIDLAACVRQTMIRENVLYQRRFVGRLKDRVRRRNPLAPDLFPLSHLPNIRTIWDFDDHYTARIFEFGTAANYYMTQSSNQYLTHIRVPALIINAQDDPMIPPSSYQHSAFAENLFLQRVEVPCGGHLGFLARGPQRFWLDHVVTAWAVELVNSVSSCSASARTPAAPTQR